MPELDLDAMESRAANSFDPAELWDIATELIAETRRLCVVVASQSIAAYSTELALAAEADRIVTNLRKLIDQHNQSVSTERYEIRA